MEPLVLQARVEAAAVVLAARLELHLLLEQVELVEPMVVVVGLQRYLVPLMAVMAALAQSVSFGRATHVASHQLAPVIFN